MVRIFTAVSQRVKDVKRNSLLAGESDDSPMPSAQMNGIAQPDKRRMLRGGRPRGSDCKTMVTFEF